jgi:hypothetical protein
MVVTQKATTTKKKLVTAEPWSSDEVSTRNCYNCLAPNGGIYVRCRRGHSMIGDYCRHKRRLTYNGVVTIPRLLKPCQGCEHFDNDWS